LFNNGSVVDVFGDINTDGSGQQWDYLDGWAYRNSGSTANGGTWDISQWTFSGANALDGESSNATASSPFPISSFTTSGGSGGSQASPIFTGITAGSYNVIITDDNGCVYSEIITIDEPTLLETSSTSGEILCFGGTTTATVSANGGTSPYTYTWNTTPNQVTATASGLVAGTYSCTVMDNNACESITTITISEPPLLVPSSTSGEILCFGGTTTVTISATGGTPPYSGLGDYVVTAGTYTYDVTDDNGCTYSTTITVDEPPLLVPSSTSGEILCFGGTTTVTVSATGGTPPYVGTGEYTVTVGSYTYDVTDANGCTYSTTIIVDEPPLLVPSSISGEILCFGGTTTVTVSAIGGTPPYAGTGDYTVTAGTYTYDVTDANGCTYSTTITVDEPPLLEVSLDGCGVVYLGAGVDYACATINTTVTGGVAGYTFDWTNTESTEGITVCPDSTSNYEVTVTDANGCTATADWQVQVVDIECSPGHSHSSHSGSGSGSHGSHSSHGSNSGSGSGSGSSSASMPSMGSGPSCSSSHSGSGSHSSHGSHSGSGSGSGSGSSSSSCHLSSYSSLGSAFSSGHSHSSHGSHSGSGSGSGPGNSSASGSASASSVSINCESYKSKGPKKVLMCFDGVTYCVNAKNIDKKLNCGYTLGPCDMQQTAACDNSTATANPVSCVCSGKLVSVTFRYVGPSFEDISVAAKNKCKIPLGDFTNVMTGDEFTIDATDAGLSYLRKDTYFEWSGVGRYKIPTNCCDNPIGQDFFPFQITGWTDTEGNSCDINSQNSGDIDNSGREVEVSLEENMIKQYPNPADHNATFEFSVIEDQEVSVSILNINGQVVGTVYSGIARANETYKFEHNVTNLQSGIYYVHLNTTNGIMKEKFVIIK